MCELLVSQKLLYKDMGSHVWLTA